MKSYPRSIVLLALVGSLLLVAAPAVAAPDLTHGGSGYYDLQDTWDSYAGRWDDSTLTFTSQVLNGSVYDLVGKFWWQDDIMNAWGWEHFTGTFDDVAMTIHLVGQYLEGEHNINLYEYDASVNTDGSAIFDGTWAGGGQWSAQFVPEPGTLFLLGSGVAALAAVGRRRRFS